MSDVPREVSRAAEMLGSAIARFERRIGRAARRKTMRRRIGPRPPRLPAARSARPARHRAVWPIRYRRGPARTVFHRVRRRDERHRGNTNRFATAVRDARERVAAAVRRAVDAIRRAVSRVRGRELARR